MMPHEKQPVILGSASSPAQMCDRKQDNRKERLGKHWKHAFALPSYSSKSHDCRERREMGDL